MNEQPREMLQTSRFGRICFTIFITSLLFGLLSFVSAIGSSWHEIADACFISGIFIIVGFIFWYIGYKYDNHKNRIYHRDKNSKSLKNIFFELAQGGTGDELESFIKEYNVNDIDIKNKYGSTALMEGASENNDPSTVRTLIRYGAKVNKQNTYSGVTPLISAAARNVNCSILELLLEHNAKLEKKRYDDKSTALHEAVSMNDNLEIIKTLLDYGANVNATDKNGKTPLMSAASVRSTDIIRLLLNYGANVNSQDKDGKTALMYAIIYNQSKYIVENLIKYGADMYTKDRIGFTPLIYAEDKNNKEIINLLLKYDSNIYDST